MPSSDWWKYPSYGFQYGMSLVQVAIDTPVYRLEEVVVNQFWQEMRNKVRPNAVVKGHKLVDPSLIEPLAEAALAGLIKRLFSVEPGEQI